MVVWLSRLLLLVLLLRRTWCYDQICYDTWTTSAVDDVFDGMWMVQCYGVNANNVYQVTAILDDIRFKHKSSHIRVEVSDSVGSDLPDDLFTGYLIQSVMMRNCGFTSLPFGVITSLPPETMLNLDLSQNQIDDIDFDRFNQLPFVQHLNALHLYSNRIAALPEDALVNLGNLTLLYLQDNLLEELVDNVFRGLEKLHALHLYENSIRSVGRDAFAGLVSLSLLAIDNNDIEFLEEGTLTTEDQTNLREITLDGNPFYCNCSLQWLKDYLTTVHYLEHSGATCIYPEIAPFEATDFCNPE